MLTKTKNSKYIVLFACLATIIATIKYSSTDRAHSPKQIQWKKMVSEVDSWTDALGLGIDPGIKDTVVVLNLLGFKTKQSCQGHIDSGRLYPWISFDIEDADISQLNDLYQDAVKRVEKEQAAMQARYPELSFPEALRQELSQELKTALEELYTLKDNIEVKAKLKMLPLKNLISSFYAHRIINPDTMLNIYELNPQSYELFSLGGDWQVARNSKEKQEKLNEYQKEMKLFTKFLTHYYFNSYQHSINISI